jgi:hypothetical protein
MTLPELFKTEPLDSLRHEHNGWCGHYYDKASQLDPCPADFAGSGPVVDQSGLEEIVKMKDPYRGDRPQPERPVPWYIPGGGTSDHADRQPPHKGTDGNPEAAGAYPHWPIEDDRPETAGE